MSDIAKKAGVSLMTVSRALKNHPRISLRTRQRLQRMAKEMGYRPDPSLSQFMARLRFSKQAEPLPIAWITNFPPPAQWRKAPILLSLHGGAQQRAHLLGYRLEEFSLAEGGMSPRRLSGILRARGIRGVIVAPHPNPGASLDLEWEFFAAATCGFSLASPSLHRAASSQFQAMQIAWEGLARLGYRRIGLALSSQDSKRVGEQWLGGILAMQTRSRASERIPPLIARDFSPQSVLCWFYKYRPDVVISDSSVLKWLALSGIRAPRDCGFAHTNAPVIGLAGVNHHMEELGAVATDLVVEQLNANRFGIPAVPKLVQITCSWQDGPTLRHRQI